MPALDLQGALADRAKDRALDSVLELADIPGHSAASSARTASPERDRGAWPSLRHASVQKAVAISAARVVPAQERVYRMRCVEAWSMVIPWLGFPLGDLLRRVEPTSRGMDLRVFF